jgi:hypothetical protein
VRPFSAILLLAWFGAGLIAPAFAAGGDSNLPACCRRDGKHHCAMPGPESAPGAAIQAVCPAFPLAGAAPAHGRIAAFRPCSAGFSVIRIEGAERILADALAPSPFSRARQKRGPPALLS